ncbi:MAG: ABC transporter ATP-binding protein [Geminicoccaceae bacterium]|nr:ABC transporter ATP-binding protein [Geminicoccaceae bacterium]
MSRAGEGSAPPLLAVDGLAKAYGGVLAVDGVSFALRPGEVLALIGPNGAGKSTCFAMLGGQIAPDRGRVRLLGRDVTGLPPRRLAGAGVGRTFQVAAAFASMTVRENVQLALLGHEGHERTVWRPFRPLGAFAAVPAEALLERVGMAADAGRPVGELAYGDLKRLEFALALAASPRLLLMDEPTAGMAPAGRGDLMRLVAETARDDGVGVLFTEHDMDVVFAHADRVMVLDRGRLIAEGTPEAVRADPQVRAVYLGGEPP